MLKSFPMQTCWLMILTMCSIAFGDDPVPANAAAVAETASAPADLSGCWSGTWQSHTNAHDGPITAWFTKLDEDHYCVHFEGRFWKLFPFQYDVVLTVTGREGDAVKMSGSSDLGLLFGTFWYEATVTETEFVASYCSQRDHGEFVMCRCCVEGDCVE